MRGCSACPQSPAHSAGITPHANGTISDLYYTFIPAARRQSRRVPQLGVPESWDRSDEEQMEVVGWMSNFLPCGLRSIAGAYQMLGSKATICSTGGHRASVCAIIPKPIPKLQATGHRPQATGFQSSLQHNTMTVRHAPSRSCDQSRALTQAKHHSPCIAKRYPLWACTLILKCVGCSKWH